MTFNRDDRSGKLLGYRFETERHLFYFGARSLTREDLAKNFPQYTFSLLKQIHSRRIMPAPFTGTLEADGQVTSQPRLAIVAQSADCMPVLLASDKQVCAIHAGWRGLQQNIIGAAADFFAGDPVRFAAIGPHIMRSSFEIEDDVRAQLVTAEASSERLASPRPSAGKFIFDLAELARRQLRKAFGETLPIAECLIDTLTSQDFHSFRRDRALAGRQYSFVVIKS